MDGFYLLVDSTGNATEVDGEVKVGRGQDNELVLEDKLVSRHHATVWMEGDVLMVRDEGSVNGTFVNRTQIYEPTALKDQDTVQFGDEVITVRAPLGEAATVLDTRREAKEAKTEVDMNPDEAMPQESAKPVEPADDLPSLEGGFQEVEKSGGLDKKWLIIGAVALVLLCCCIVVGVGGWFLLNQ
jgi:pSer/pThr/pTyr-binding forkhead associated (FHA) protein